MTFIFPRDEQVSREKLDTESVEKNCDYVMWVDDWGLLPRFDRAVAWWCGSAFLAYFWPPFVIVNYYDNVGCEFFSWVFLCLLMSFWSKLTFKKSVLGDYCDESWILMKFYDCFRCVALLSLIRHPRELLSMTWGAAICSTDLLNGNSTLIRLS